MKKSLAIAALVAAGGMLGWQAYRRQAASAVGGGRGGGQSAEGPAVAVEVAAVRRATIRDVGSFTGSMVAKSYFVVAPKISGRLRRLTVDIGDRVRRGQMIAVLDDDEYAQAVEQARAELAVAKANVSQRTSSVTTAKREYERVQELRRKKISSESELDIASSQYEAASAGYEVAVAQVARAQAALRAAEVRLSYTEIRASWEDGSEHASSEVAPVRMVGERFVDEGAMLKANAPIVSILDITSVTAVVHVVEREYSRMGIGHEASVSTDAFPGRTFRGRVVRMAPLLKETSRQARVEIDIANADLALKPGMFVQAKVVFAERDDTTVVPVDALARRDGRRGVFLVDTARKTVGFVPVTLGIVEGDLAEVLEPEISGLVVTLGQHLLEDGSAVILPANRQTGASR